jgi:hypothetical protein
MTMKRLAATLFFLCLSASAFAQQVPPYVYPITLGTASIQILANNPGRKKLIFTNPNDTAKVAVCPVGPSPTPGSSQTPVAAVINGPGCATLLPYQSMEVPGQPVGGGPLSMPSAWVGIASAGSSGLTIWEFQ